MTESCEHRLFYLRDTQRMALSTRSPKNTTTTPCQCIKAVEQCHPPFSPQTAMNWSTFWFSRQHPVTQNKCTPGCVIQTAHLHNSYPLFTHTFSLFVGWGFRASQAVSTERLLKLWAPSCYTAMLPKDSHAMRRALCLNRPLSHQPYAGGQGLTKYLHCSLRKLSLLQTFPEDRTCLP